MFAQMLGIAGAERDDIDPRLVAGKAIGSVGDAAGAAVVMQEEAEWFGASAGRLLL
jgi:hypothetical protein